jgi:ATP-dependent Lon protease
MALVRPTCAGHQLAIAALHGQLRLTALANLFGHMNGRDKGMVAIWDAVAFDEIADLQKMPREVITTLKTYCESGQFQRGREAASGYASIAMFGNTDQPIDVMVQTGHLFAPMPDVNP